MCVSPRRNNHFFEKLSFRLGETLIFSTAKMSVWSRRNARFKKMSVSSRRNARFFNALVTKVGLHSQPLYRDKRGALASQPKSGRPCWTRHRPTARPSLAHGPLGSDQVPSVPPTETHKLSRKANTKERNR